MKQNVIEFKKIDPKKDIDAQSTTIVPTTTSLSDTLIEESLSPYPLWHLLFWISPYFAGYWGGGWFLLVSYIVSKLTASGSFQKLNCMISNVISQILNAITKNDALTVSVINWTSIIENFGRGRSI